MFWIRINKNRINDNLFKIFIAILFASLISLCRAGNIYAFQGGKEIHKSFKVEKGQKLLMELSSGGSISITGWDKDEVVVDVAIKGRDQDNCLVNFDQSSAGIEIHSKYKNESGSHSGSTHFEIKVPNKFNLKLHTMGGGIDIRDVEGKFTGRTMGGRIDLSSLKGYVELSTMGGEISLTDSEVDGKLSTMGGNVLIENVKGDVDGSTMGGKVTMKNVTQKSNHSSDTKE